MPYSLQDPEYKSTKYWASEEDLDTLAGLVEQKVAAYWDALTGTGRLDLYRRAVQLYYGLDVDGSWAKSSAVTYGGKQGENVQLRANLFRTYIEHLVVMTIPERPAFNAKSLNYDPESLEAANLAKSILHFDMEQEGGEDLIYRAAEFQRIFAEGWLFVGWDDKDGIEMEDEYGTVSPTGKLRKYVYDPTQIARDPYVDFNKHKWFIITDKESRWELAAKYPMFEEEILQAPSVRERNSVSLYGQDTTFSEDEVFTYYLFHKDGKELPGGRRTLVIGSTVIEDGPIGYSDFPLHCMADSVEMHSAWAYTKTWDGMALDKAFNSMLSTMVTNHDMSGVQNIQIPMSAQLDEDDFAGGANVWRVNPGEEIKAVNLTNTSEHSYRGLELNKSLMMETFGLSGVTQGKGESGVRSGDHAALLYTAASRINSKQQRNAAKAIEWYGNQIISVYKQFAKVPQLTEILGRKMSPQVVEFVGSNLSPIHKVSVEIVNAQFNSYAHRSEILKELITLSNVDGTPAITPQQAMDFMATGKLAFEDRFTAQRALIEKEREMLEAGDYPQPLATHHHAFHIQQHMSILDKDPKLIRNNPDLVKRVLAHITEHAELWKLATQNQPALLMATGQQPAPMPQPPMPGPGGPPGGKGPGGAPPPGAPPQSYPEPGSAPPGEVPSMPPELEGSGVEMPQPPKPQG